MPSNRQLAAILFTDVAGYTAMMQRDEQAAIRLIKHHRAILENKIEEYGGLLIEFYGDGSLSTFGSITEAMLCAIDIQQQMKAEPAVPLRIGVHIGEVIFEDDKIMGDGVNIAARIQSLGQAGSILFSREVFDKTKNHPEFKTVALGTFQLKNVSEPMDVYALANDGLVVPVKEKIEGRVMHSTGERPTRRKTLMMILAAIIVVLLLLFLPGWLRHKARFSSAEKSVAVLPFENISNDTLQQYFSDGITEDIITQLSTIANLKVISRTSVMQYKGTRKNIREIAEELGVASILEGSVRKEGEKVRITAQLIDAQTDKHLWAETFDRNASEVFAIQSEVAHRIAGALNVKLTTAEDKRIVEKATANVEAYDEYLKAKKLFWSDKIAPLLRVIKKDSSFSLAWAELASAYSKMPWGDPGEKPYYVRKSLEAALTAVEYGPERSETHMILGDVLKFSTLSPTLAIKELNKSIELNANNADGYVYLAFAQMESGHFREAEKNLQKAKLLDPLSWIMHSGWLTLFRYSRQADRYRSYINEMSGSRNVDSIIPGTKLMYHFLKDQYDSMLLEKSTPYHLLLRGIAYTKTGQTIKAKNMADSLERVSPNNNAYHAGVLYAWAGYPEKAIEKLNLAYRLYDYGMISIKVDKLFDPLRNEEGFKQLQKKMGLE